MARFLQGELAIDQQWDPGDLVSITHFDNDLFSPRTSDSDYTTGLGLTLAGSQIAQSPFSLLPILDLIDPLFSKNRTPASARDGSRYAMQIGLLAFTPNDLNTSEPIEDDRPYASLLFLSTARLQLEQNSRVARRSTFVVGFLGLNAFGSLQKTFHVAIGMGPPRGWSNQISDGGELTVRYVRSRQEQIGSWSSDYSKTLQLSWTGETSVGYLSESSIAVSARWGRINTPWWSFTPEQADYMSRPVADASALRSTMGSELFLFAGLKLRGRIYNAFLQGQFRDSAVRYSFSELNHVIAEGWVGVKATFNKNTTLSYTLRYNTQEVRYGIGARDTHWGNLALERRF